MYILDPWFANPDKVCANRYNFLLESLRDLDLGLRKVGSRLFVVRGRPADVLPRLAAEWAATRVTWEIDVEPYARARDAELEGLLTSRGVEVRATHGHTLWEPRALLAAAKGSMPSAYASFVTLTGKLPVPDKPLPSPTAAVLPPPTPGAMPDASHGVPSLAEMGYDPSAVTTPFVGQGGESAALAKLAANLARGTWLAAFNKPETNPTALRPDTTALSPYLKFGCLGVRQFYWGLRAALDAERAAGRAVTVPPVSLEGQLLWREFFYAQGFATPNFDRMEGNPICRQIAWKYDAVLLRAWEEGRTGYPWIDAAMAQLKLEGWMHHLARHAVACFLTRGDLYQSWEHGARVFDKYLLDSDWSVNVGNWLWLSASAYFYQFFRVYSPQAFPKKTDPNGDYIRKYLPQFKDFPAKYIYEPWTAPVAMQEKYGVVVGVSYPARVVIHEVVSKENITAHTAAYAAAREGAKAAAVVTAQAAPGSKGIGQTQVGSDPRAAEAYFARMGVTAGQLPSGGAAGSASSASGREGGSGGSAPSSSKRPAGGQTELDTFYKPAQKKAKKGKAAGKKGDSDYEED